MSGRPAALLFLLPLVAAAACQPSIFPIAASETLEMRNLPLVVQGRVIPEPGGLSRQWPGTYFETSFAGRGAAFRIGTGEVTVHVIVDGRLVRTLVKPVPAVYRVDDLKPGRHKLRIEIASESQNAPTVFGGFYADRDVKPLSPSRLARQIEFIGDSYTVGYGNTSRKRECSEGEVWTTTDTSQAFGPLLAKRYGADYQVNAISGRGIVRNYDGFEADTLPAAYPFALLNRPEKVRDPEWNPQLVVISLGTNDFSTPLKPGERWLTREELRADYENKYVQFVRQLRAGNPRATFILWSTDTAEGEVANETRRVVAKLRASGDSRVAFLLVPALSFSGCDYHPSVADDRVIAERLAAVIEAQEPFGR